MIVLLSYSINLLAQNNKHFSTGELDSVRISYNDLRIVNSKLVELDYTKVDKENMLKGTAYRYFFPSMLELEFSKGLVPLEKEKKNTK